MIELRAPADVWLQFYADDAELGARHSPTVDGRTTFEIDQAPPALLVKVFDLEREAGSYVVSVRFVPRLDPASIRVDDPPNLPDARRYCAVGEVSDACRRAPPCDWVHVDPDNPRCAPQYRPPAGP